MANESKVKKVFGIIGTVLFFLSYIPFTGLITAGAEGALSGLFGGRYLYGFEAMWNTFVWLCVIPIYPFCILYQLIFGIAYIRKHKTLKFITIGIVAALVIAILGVGIFYQGKYERDAENAVTAVEEYMMDNYGPELAEDISVRVLDPTDNSYMVSSPVLPDGMEFVVNLDSDFDTLVDSFCTHNDEFRGDFHEYLREQYDLPDNVSFQYVLSHIDFGSYRYGEDYTELYDDVDYRISGVEISLGELDDTLVLDTVNDVYENMYPEIADHLSDDWYTVYIKSNGRNAFYINCYLSGEPTARIYTYSDYRGLTELNNAQIDLG